MPFQFGVIRLIQQHKRLPTIYSALKYIDTKLLHVRNEIDCFECLQKLIELFFDKKLKFSLSVEPTAKY